jgi:hypothetical protein
MYARVAYAAVSSVRKSIAQALGFGQKTTEKMPHEKQ